MRTRSMLIPATAVLVLGALARSGVVRAAAAAGAISGTVTYTGTPPKAKPIDMAKEPACAQQHATPVTTEAVVTGPGNALRWVVVYISAGDQGAAASAAGVRYDQKGCQYIHPLAKVNPEWNKSQPKGAPPIHTKFEQPEFIPVKCNIHPWMHGYFVVLTAAHSTVTDENGGFTLTGLPPGKYTVTAWHEQFGTQSQEVTISGTETKTIHLVFKATPY